MDGRIVSTNESLDKISRDLRDILYVIKKYTIRGSVLKEEHGRNNKAWVEGKLLLLLKILMRVIHQK